MKRITIFTSFLLTLLLAGAVANAQAAYLDRCDFNNDGFTDLAIGLPEEDVGSVQNAGAVQVMYGRPGGLSATNNQFWHKDLSTVLGNAQSFERFGWALTCGDFNGDGNDDVAIGAIGHAENSDLAGSVTVLYGSSNRLTGAGDQLWTQDSPGVLDQAEPDDYFGYALAEGDFNGDGIGDLAVGVPFEDSETGGSFGAVQVFYGSSSGLTSQNNQFWLTDTLVAGGTDFGAFGLALAAADFGNDTSSACFDDLAIGDAGVRVLFGSQSGLTAAGNQYLDQDSPGIPGTNEFFDNFAASLTVANFRGIDAACGSRKIADLVISADSKTINSLRRAGAVFVIYGSDNGLTSTNSQMWTQSSAGIADEPEDTDRFGFAIAAGHSTSGRDYLVIGVPNEDANSIFDAGAIHVLQTDPATGLVTGSGSKFLHQSTPGIKDSAERGDQFGASVATGDFNGDGQDDVAVGVPLEDLHQVTAVGAINILYSADTSATQFFHQDSPDMKDSEEFLDHFGIVLGKD